MSFLYPAFLWALTALTIPVIIHLFNFRKTTRIFFSNIRFLKQIKQETTQKRRLKKYLVLASRLLFIFFLVIAFAQPFLPAREQVGAQKNIAIYLDNSFSMSAPVNGKTRALDAGISFVREIVDLFPAETRFDICLFWDFLSYLDDPALRSRGTGESASIVARIPEVRRALLDYQREFARRPPGAVLDGRDIGTVVCPDADVKIYVTATLEVRANRRYLERKPTDPGLELEAVIAQVKARDERDSGREAAPLRKADDAHLLDTTHLDIDSAVRAAVALIDQKTGSKGRTSP